MTLVDALVVVSLILVNALYVAAEFGAVAARKSRIRELAEHGSRLAARILPVLEDPARLDRYIAGCQIGITLSSLVLGAYGQSTMAVRLSPLFEAWAGLDALAAFSAVSAGVLVTLTILQVVFGELLPKSLALQYPTQTVLYTEVPMRWSLWLFHGFIAVMNGSGVALLRLLRLPQGSHRHIHSPEEIELLIVESRDGGLLEPDEQVRLHRALRLRLRSARQLMVPRPYISAIDVNTPFERAVMIAAQTPYTRLPAYRDSIDNVVGFLHTRDVVLRAIEGRPAKLTDLVRPVPTVHERLSADELLRLLREQKAYLALVVDEFGGLAGLVTVEDVLAELLGDVGDEFTADRGPERLPDGRVRVPGRLPLDEIERWVGIAWRGDASTVGGHVTDSLGHVPRAGDRLVIAGCDVLVEEVVRYAVTSVVVTPAAGERSGG